MTRLTIPIATITEKGLHRSEQIDATHLPSLPALSAKEKIGFHRSIDVKLHLTGRQSEAIRINGTIGTTARMTCSRCLAPFDAVIQAEFSTAAMPEPLGAAGEKGHGEEIELNAAEMDVIRYAGEIIDLREEIAQQVIMALPFSPLCTDHCKGLCSHCGVNLNQQACTCRTDRSENPFAVLKKLELPPKKE